MKKLWQDLSVSKKLYAVVGLMAILIALELLTLLFAMNTLSAVRALVNGEGVWSKSQKNAIQSLYLYAIYQEEQYYTEFNNYLAVPKGDRLARHELMKPDYDYEIVKKGFMQGGNHPSDIDGMIHLLRRFYTVSYLNSAIVAWAGADILIDELIRIAEDLHQEIQAGHFDRNRLRKSIDRVSAINAEISILENAFSESLGAGSRWLESVLMSILLLTVLTIGSAGLYLTFRFGRDLKKNIGDRKEAESANQFKSLFLANMSHEIRTPLGVILGFAEALKDPLMSAADRTNYLEVIERTGKSLSRIINDILDLSKVESGHLEVENTTFPLQELIDELQLLFQLQAQERGNILKFQIQPTAPLTVFSDRLRLQQILMNLISNALRFTHEGEITVTCSYHGNTWLFRVTDTGIGLDEEQKKKLFTLFSQADQSTTRKYGGTGLGLVLSKRLAELLDGDVILETTTLNKGSSFMASVSETISPSQEPSATKQNTLANGSSVEHLRGKHILIVDDSEENQILLRFYLMKAGLEVQSAANGAMGVEKALKNNFDLVLMDIQMPIMDGYTATKTLRATGYTKPIIALTANAMKEDRERSIVSGCHDYLTKPINSTRLLTALAKHIS
jgi:two-component system, sensor histidine kinase